MSQCQHVKDDGEQCGSSALKGRDYCRHHIDSEKVVEAEGKSLESLEGKAIGVLKQEMADGTGPNARVKAARVALEHVRESE